MGSPDQEVRVVRGGSEGNSVPVFLEGAVGVPLWGILEVLFGPELNHCLAPFSVPNF